MNKLYQYITVAVVAILLSGCEPKQKAGIEGKIETILSQMTLEQKIGQMQQTYIRNRITEVPESIKEAIRKGKLGSILNAGSPDMIAEMQKIAIEESPQGIPLIIGRDVIHGFQTIFPIPLGQAASWNREIVKEGARVAAVEASEVGINWTFAPMIDISRDPRWGRIAESLGEDPVLSAELGLAMVKGFQGDSLTGKNGSIAACAKHFIGYGATENGKDYNPTFIPTNRLWNVYIPPFKKAIEGGCATVMTAFNDINGIPASGNKFLLKDVLRKKLDFDGFVVSDWHSMPQMISQGYCRDTTHVAEVSSNAGLDMEMVSKGYADHLTELIEQGKVSEASVDQSVRNILRIKFRLNLFDNPYKGLPSQSSMLSDQHKKAAAKAAIESVVMLKNNNGVLPISNDKKVAVIGPLADNKKDQLGCWVFDGVVDEAITPLSALKKELGNKVKYAKGLNSPRDFNKDQINTAVRVAKSADVVVMFLGEDAILSGEGHSRSILNLPGAQKELVQEVAKAGKPIVAVLMAGRPLVFGDLEPYFDAIYYAWHPGTMGGKAISDLLLGKQVPSGKLPVTFPRTVGQIPIYYSSIRSGRPANEKMLGIPTGTPLNPVGLSNNYLDVSVKPAYPFGFGLSYTTFKYSSLEMSQNTMTKSEHIQVEVTVKNIGEYNGAEVVQLYIKDHVGSLMRPQLELKDFKKIHLVPGESKKVSFEITPEMLSFYDSNGKAQFEKGEFTIYIGSSSADLKSEKNISVL